MGTEEIVDEGTLPPGEGKRGIISGDNSLYGDGGGVGRIAGAADIVVGISKLRRGCEDKESEGEAIKAMISGAMRNPKGCAI